MEAYFTLKLYGLLALIGLLTIYLIVIDFIMAKALIRRHMIIKFFSHNGYKRKILGASQNNGVSFCGWVRETDGRKVADKTIEKWSLIKIKKEYK